MRGADESDENVAGRSARREFERRRESAEAQVKPGLLKALLGPSREEKRRAEQAKQWRVGAEGEELLAERLLDRCPDVALLHDRRRPGTRANIDHIAVAPSGVYVIDTKRYRGKVVVRRPLFGATTLRINGRDQSKLIAGLDKQVAAVRAALAGIAPEPPLHGCLCFVPPEGLLADDGLPLFKTLQMNGYPLLYPRRLIKRLNAPGPLSPEQVREIHSALAARLPAA